MSKIKTAAKWLNKAKWHLLFIAALFALLNAASIAQTSLNYTGALVSGLIGAITGCLAIRMIRVEKERRKKHE